MEHLEQLISAAAIPGVALAVVERGQVNVISMGVRERGAVPQIGEATIFDVASLSKPVVAYVALQLFDAGILDLDEPLSKIVRDGISSNLASSAITARHVLTHTSGLPNLRGAEPLRTYFSPGSWFSYSSVGFNYLQKTLEVATNETLEALAERLVFAPLRMHSSSFQWRERFNEDFALPHEDERVVEKHRPTAATASYSLQTTAGDYAKFIAAVLEGKSLTRSTARQWLTPATMVPQGDAVYLVESPPTNEREIGWGLGWGVETTTGAFFQWGKMDGIRAFAMGNPRTRSAVVLLTNSNRGLRLMDAVAEMPLPGNHPAFSWLRACVAE